MVKPSNFDELQRMIKTAHEYWSLCLKPEPLAVQQPAGASK